MLAVHAVQWNTLWAWKVVNHTFYSFTHVASSPQQSDTSTLTPRPCSEPTSTPSPTTTTTNAGDSRSHNHQLRQRFSKWGPGTPRYISQGSSGSPRGKMCQYSIGIDLTTKNYTVYMYWVVFEADLQFTTRHSVMCCGLKKQKQKNIYKSCMGVPSTKYFLMRVCGQIHINLWVLDLSKFESHWHKRFKGRLTPG